MNGLLCSRFRGEFAEAGRKKRICLSDPRGGEPVKERTKMEEARSQPLQNVFVRFVEQGGKKRGQ